jgi:hypothetical protein
MQQHGPDDLIGPLRGTAVWWQSARDASGPVHDGQDLDAAPLHSADNNGIRRDLVERVRRDIAAGLYDTPEKWRAALDRLLDRLEHD